jgi:curved DNA-binding protein CbpA
MMDQTHTYYESLKVARNAPPEVIRAAYKALSQRYHPDKNNHAEAAEIMRCLNQAYAVLGDPNARQDYDTALAASEGVTRVALHGQRHRDAQLRGRHPIRSRRGQKALTRIWLMVILAIVSAVAATFVQSDLAYAASVGVHAQR